MSFRARLSLFFALIVVIPLAVIGVLVFGLIDGSNAGKADARAAGVAAAAASLYSSSSADASLDARIVARQLAATPVDRLPAQARQMSDRYGIVRLQVLVGGRRLVDVGDPTAVAPGIAVVPAAGGRPGRTFVASQLNAPAYARRLAGSGIAVVVRRHSQTLAASRMQLASLSLPGRRATVSAAGRRYRAVSERFPGAPSGHAGGATAGPVTVTVLSDLAATGHSVAGQRTLAGVFLIGFLVLAGFFTLLSSRALQRQLRRFLDAARRLADGDFSATVPTAGNDEFAALGEEFNRMSRELETKLSELEQERARVRVAIRRIGEAFASGLDRDALLELALRTAMDATGADRGRIQARAELGDSLAEVRREGSFEGLEGPLREVERRALGSRGIDQFSRGDRHVAAVALGQITRGGPAHGVIAVARQGRPFSDDDLELLRSLASQATLALANVNIHDDVRRQAITDDLTGLASHGHFQELLDAEMREVRRYDYPVGLVMFDIDNFKSVNDTYGHQQGDAVLRAVADALRECSRDADLAARYGGEEMALVLPHTDADGAYEIAERVRTAIESLDIVRLDGKGEFMVTTSVGVAASADGDKDALIAAADAALYVAKRTGKNRTVRAGGPPESALADAVAGGAEE